jgi:hypothetical protein
MEREKALENCWYPDVKTVEPHFDDERTLLSAQPVVPLEAVSKTQIRRRLMFVGAFVIAAVLGAGAALALVRVKQAAVARSTSEANAAEHSVQEPVVETVTTTETKKVESSPDPQEPENAEESSEAVAVIPQTRRAKPRVVTNRRSSAPQMTISIRPTEQPSDDGPAGLLDQWQERRQRRVNRKPDNHHRSELFRIREIFEGPRQPRRPDY